MRFFFLTIKDGAPRVGIHPVFREFKDLKGKRV